MRRARGSASSTLSYVPALLVLGAFTIGATTPPPPPPTPSSPALLGFSADHAAAQRALESKLDAAMDAQQIGEWIRVLSARPHHVGSPYDKENAERTAELFKQWGYDTAIERFDVLFPTPKERILEMTAPTTFKASLEEDALPEDSTSGQKSEQLPTYNAYSIDGDVTGELVYVHYGVPADYEELAKHGIDVKGKIVLARYGGSWRGIKPKVAAEHGAVGCIIFADPHEDGYFQGDMYPKGGWRPPQGVQRGSVADMPTYAGDPLTPGVGAVPGARRLPLAEAKTLTRIPVLPISAKDAEPLLAALAGPMAPEHWRGAFPIPYHLGPGPAKAHLKVAFDWQTRPVYDVIAKLRGADLPDEWVVRGNHHDAWVNGALDPSSGAASLLAEAQAVGKAAREGWRPRRTIVYALWDGEEPGLLGSTEWAETHADELKKKAVAYINSDTNSRGFFSAGGSHALEPFVNQVMQDVIDPELGRPIGERTRAYTLLSEDATQEQRDAAKSGRDLPIDPLGSGSDFTPFLQHVGVAALNIGFGGEEQYGQYHSIYDSFDHFTRFGDPGFRYGVALAQTGGRLTTRLADADRLPFDLSRLAGTIHGYAGEVEKLAASMRESTAEENRRIREGIYTAAWDPQEHMVVPAAKEPVPFLNFAPLDNAVSALQDAAARHDKAAAAATLPLSPSVATAHDQAIIAIEHALTYSKGLPNRPWFQHEIYAPGIYTGYGVKTLPGIREAIEQRRYTEAEAQIAIVADVLHDATAAIDRATAALK